MALIQGTSGNDNLFGTANDDTMLGDAGDDFFRGTAGADSIDGGTGTDRVSYYPSPGAVNVNLATGVATNGYGQTQTLVNIENISGTNGFADVITGDANDNTFYGNGGNDTMDGGAGSDTVGYMSATGAVTVNLATGTSSGADGVDSFSNFENISGTYYDDQLTGDGNNNVLDGRGGTNTLTGAGGNDTLLGGNGQDVAIFSGNRADYRVSTDAAGVITVQDMRDGTPDGTDTLKDIQILKFADTTVQLTAVDHAVASSPAGYQIYQSSATLAGGSYVIAFRAEDGSGDGIYFRQFKHDGTPLGDDVAVNTSTTGDQRQPAVAALEDGGFVVAFASSSKINPFGNDTTWEIKLQRYDASGIAVGGELSVNTTSAGEQRFPAVTGTTDGGFLVTWQSRQEPSLGIYAQKFNADGSTAGGETHINTTTAGGQYGPAVTSLAGGGYVITWNGVGKDGLAGIQQQLFNGAGVAVGSETLVSNSLPESVQPFGTLRTAHVMDAATGAINGYVTTWLAYQPDHSASVMVRHFHADGTPSGAAVELAHGVSGSSTSSGSNVIGTWDGGYMAVWDVQGADGSHILARHFDSAGVPLAAAFEVSHSPVLGNKGFPALALADDRVAISWTSQGPGTNSAGGVYQQVVDLDGHASFVYGGNLGDKPAASDITVQNMSGGNDTQFDPAYNGRPVYLLNDALASGASTGNNYFMLGGTAAFGSTVKIYNGSTLVAQTGAGDDGEWHVQVLDLAPGSYALQAYVYDPLGNRSDAGSTFNLTVLAPVAGGAGEDTLVASGTDNLMVIGNGGSDVLIGNNAGNIELGGDGDDMFLGAADDGGNDLMNGQAGNDFFRGSPGADTIIGGEGTDRISYVRNEHGVVVNLAAGTADDGSGAIDKLLEIENISGSNYNDLIIGDAQNNLFYGNGGNDTLDGGDGYDTADYGFAAGAVSVNLGNGSVSGADGADQLFNIEAAVGSYYNDSLVGSAADNRLEGLRGDDTMVGGGGNDILLGGTGNNVAVFSGNKADYTITLNANGGTTVIDKRAGAPDGMDSVYQTQTLRFADGDVVLTPVDHVVATNTGNYQTFQSQVGLQDGSYVVAFRSSDGNGDGIYMRRFLADGTPFGGSVDTLVNTATSGDQRAPVVTSLADGGFVIAYHSAATVGALSNDGSWDIRLQRYDANSVKVGGEVAVNADTAGAQRVPSVTAVNDGGMVVVWQTLQGGNMDVHAQKFNADGSRSGGETTVNTTAAGFQGSPVVVGKLDGYVVMWLGAGADGHQAVSQQAFDNNGNKVGGETVVATVADGLDGQFLRASPMINPENDDWQGYVVSWIEGHEGNTRVMVRQYDGDGVAVGAAIEVATADSGYHNGCSVTGLTDGGFMALWDSEQPDGQSAIMGRHYDATGTPVGAAFTISHTPTLGVKLLPTAVETADGLVAVSWGTQGSPMAGTGGIYQQVIDFDGNPTFLVGMSTPPTPAATTVTVQTVVGGANPVIDPVMQTYTLNGPVAANGTISNSHVLLSGMAKYGSTVEIKDGSTVLGVVAADDDGRWVLELKDMSNGSHALQATVINLFGVRSDASAAMNFTVGTALVGTANGDNTSYWIAQGANGNAQRLQGLGGNDTMNGLGGADTLEGGVGDDLYHVNHKDAVVVEAAGAGIDTVMTTVNYTLTANVENLELKMAGLTGIGNTGANKILGTDGSDTLDGAGGIDTLTGGNGNDLYFVDVAGDVVVEAENGGHDHVNASGASYTLGANVEELFFTGTGVARTGLGNGIGNFMVGNSLGDKLDGAGGEDVLVGLDGNDTLLGGADSDTLVGGAGNDSLDGGVITDRSGMSDGNVAVYQSAAAGINVNLATGTATDGLGGTDKLVNINMIIASNFNDTLAGSASDLSEVFEGKGGDDVINGGAIVGDGMNIAGYFSANGAVTVNLASGTASGADIGTDTLVNISGVMGSDFNDTIIGGANPGYREHFMGGKGNDSIDGGAGVDFVHYNEATAGVNVNLATGIASDGEGGTDTLAHIEGVVGSAFDDTLVGASDPAMSQVFVGNGGNDSIVGAAWDTVDYSSSEGAIVADLHTGIVLDGMGGTDTVSGIQRVLGSALADAISGNGHNNVLEGGAGNDTIVAGVPTNEWGDNVTYAHSKAAVSVNLAAGSASDGLGGTDTLVNVHNAMGSDFHDTLVGSDGVDVLNGGLGNDSLMGGAAHDTLAGDQGNDTLRGEGGDDDLYFYGGWSSQGDSGNDLFDGGAGQDTAHLFGSFNDYTFKRISATDLMLTHKVSGFSVTLHDIETVAFDYDADVRTMASMLDNVPSIYNDRITGTGEGETINGLAGDDTMTGLGGDDTYILDSVGDNVVEAGGGGNDTVNLALATAGQTYVMADNVETLVLTNAVATNVTGNDTSNSITGNGAANTLVGGEGHDTLYGGAGGDRLDGGNGNDSLVGGVGADTMLGGDGDDTYFVEVAGDSVSEGDSAGTDKVVITADSTLATYTLGANVENLEYQGKLAITLNGNTLNNRITGSNSNSKLSGDAGDDILMAGTGNDLLSGGTGNDVLGAGGNGKDTLDGGTGTDMALLEGSASDWTVARPNATDTVLTRTGTSQVVTLRGVEGVTFTGAMQYKSITDLQFNIVSLGDDTLQGTAGNDTMDGKAGADVMAGLDGDDTYIIDNAGDQIVETGGAGSGRDLAKIGITVAGKTFVLGDNVEDAIVTSTVATNVTGNELDNTITGNGAANTIAAGEGNDSVDGGAGNDVLFGGLGNDTLVGGTGTDTLNGDLGDDTYVVDATTDRVEEVFDGGTDTVRCSAASFTLGDFIENLSYTGTAAFTGTGNQLDNVIKGGSGADKLYGGAGNDTLSGGLTGADLLDGGADNDVAEVGGIASDWKVTRPLLGDTVLTNAVTKQVITLRNVETIKFLGDSSTKLLAELQDNVVSAFADNITGTSLADIIDGKAGADTMAGLGGDDTYLLDNVGDTVVEEVGGGIDLVKLGVGFTGTYALAANVEKVLVTATVAVNVTGNDLGNTITGNGAINVLDGGDGNDSLDGGAGNDTLIGGAGHDTLAGGTGSDSMSGGDGNDLYTVDVAGDIVVELDGEGNDTVQTGLASYKLSDYVETLRYTGTAAFTGTGNGQDNLIQGGIGADKLFGGDGNDTLVGGAGNDALTGGNGADQFVISLATLDTVADFVSGTDKVRFDLTGITLGNGNGDIDAITTIGTPGGFATTDDVVIVTTNLAALTAAAAATAIGSANSAYTLGAKQLFVVDNGVNSQVYLFTSTGTDAIVSAAELKQIAQLTGVASTVAGDFSFMPI